MNKFTGMVGAVSTALVMGLAVMPADLALAQDADPLEEVVVTGSRIRRNPLNEGAAVMDIGVEKLDQSGFTNLGDALKDRRVLSVRGNEREDEVGTRPVRIGGLGAGAPRPPIQGDRRWGCCPSEAGAHRLEHDALRCRWVAPPNLSTETDKRGLAS